MELMLYPIVIVGDVTSLQTKELFDVVEQEYRSVWFPETVDSIIGVVSNVGEFATMMEISQDSRPMLFVDGERVGELQEVVRAIHDKSLQSRVENALHQQHDPEARLAKAPPSSPFIEVLRKRKREEDRVVSKQSKRNLTISVPPW